MKKNSEPFYFISKEQGTDKTTAFLVTLKIKYILLEACIFHISKQFCFIYLQKQHF